jgi:hypothetical protein
VGVSNVIVRQSMITMNTVRRKVRNARFSWNELSILKRFWGVDLEFESFHDNVFKRDMEEVCHQQGL